MRETEKQRGNIEEARKELIIARRTYKPPKKQWEKKYWDTIIKQEFELGNLSRLVFILMLASSVLSIFSKTNLVGERVSTVDWRVD